jgi:hypothetical protein
MRKSVLTCTLLLAASLGAGCNRAPQSQSLAAADIDSSKYYAVLLNNGAVYFGRLAGLGTPFPVLTEVYYVQSATNPETKAVSNILVKRGKEWHGPDRMILNEKSIVFVEPVGPDSKVAQLISESKK